MEITNISLVQKRKEKDWTKSEILEILANLIGDEFKVDPKPLLENYLKREDDISTGLGEGIAIPHAISPGLKEPKIIVFQLETPVDWNSLDGSLVDLIISIVVPEGGREDHFYIITGLAAKLIDEDFKNQLRTSDPKDVVELINSMAQEILIKQSEDNKSENDEQNNQELKQDHQLRIVGITSCATGVAHTFMAAEALEKEARKRGHWIKIEKQGQMTKDKLKQNEIDEADVAVFALGKGADDPERFRGKKLLEIPVAEPITRASEVLDKIENCAKEGTVYQGTGRGSDDNSSSSINATSNKKKKSFGTGPMRHLLAGISYMIPFIAMAGITLGLTTAFGYETVDINGQMSFVPKNGFWNGLSILSGAAFTLYIPILAGYIANSIAGRHAIAPAMILAFVFNINPVGTSANFGSTPVEGVGPFWNWSTMSFAGFENSTSLGFLGAIASGYLVGYGIVWFTKYTDKVNSRAFQTMVPLIIIPLVFTIIPYIAFAFFLYLPLYWLGIGLGEGVKGLIDINMFWLVGIILGVMICFDLGGPVNKMAMAIGVMFLTIGPTYNPSINGICAVAVAIPPMVLFATLIFGRAFGLTFNEEEKAGAASAGLMGFFGITEGSIPFAAKNPKVWMPSFMIAGAVGGGLAAVTGVGNNVAMWGGPIIYIAGGMGNGKLAAETPDLIMQTNYVYALLYFIPLIVAAFVGLGVASSLNKYYQYNDRRFDLKSKIKQAKLEELTKENELLLNRKYQLEIKDLKNEIKVKAKDIYKQVKTLKKQIDSEQQIADLEKELKLFINEKLKQISKLDSLENDFNIKYESDLQFQDNIKRQIVDLQNELAIAIAEFEAKWLEIDTKQISKRKESLKLLKVEQKGIRDEFKSNLNIEQQKIRELKQTGKWDIKEKTNFKEVKQNLKQQKTDKLIKTEQEFYQELEVVYNQIASEVI